MTPPPFATDSLPPEVVVIDDDDAVRDAVAWLLEASGRRVVTLPDAESWLATADTAPPPGCLLVDVKMPSMSGLELLRAVVKRPNAPPVILMTAHGDVPTAVSALKAGAIDFIEKPFDDSDLLRSVAEALDQAQARRQSDARRQQAQEKVALLTPRERDVLDLLIKGDSNKAMALTLGISPRTVEVHRARVMEKLGVQSVSEVVRLALLALGEGA